MARIILIACSKTQAGGPCAAQDLYQSRSFKLSLAYAEELLCNGKANYIYILSTKHGLVDLTQTLHPYNVASSEARKKAWSSKVLSQIQAKGHHLATDDYLIIAGQNFYKGLVGAPGGIQRYTII